MGMTIDEIERERRRQDRERWIGHLNEAMEHVEPAEVIDGPALLAAMRDNHRSLRMLQALAAALVAGGALAIEDAADALALASKADVGMVQQARRDTAHRMRRRS
jgi:hypothetical protein